MLNQAKPASASGWKSGRTLVLLLPSSNPPPCTRMAAGNGPAPSGTCRSSSNFLPPASPYATSLWSSGAPANTAAHAIPNRYFVIVGDCIARRTRKTGYVIMGKITMIQETLSEGLTFDDVLLEPARSEVLP